MLQPIRAFTYSLDTKNGCTANTSYRRRRFNTACHIKDKSISPDPGVI
uniref:Uncharacterized protein n=1 Tax=Anguilla anguilla TaxID=7936 RepID=A0A0E9WBB0_ANGAN